MNCVFELDDFQTDEVSLYALTELKQRYPAFKATYYTILGNSDLTVLRDLAKLDWLELALHGLDHNSERFWKYADMIDCLDYAESLGLFSKLFKMPWYDPISEGIGRALAERDYKVATRRRTQTRQLRGLGIWLWLGCPWTVYAHPPTLPDKIDDVDWESFDTFYTVSEMFGKRAQAEQWVVYV